MNQKVNFVFSIIILMTFVSCNRTRLKNALNPEDFSALAAAKSCEVTYNENIAPLIQNSCVGCHSDAGIASFSKLDSYSALVAHREQVLKQVQTKRMPPIGRAKALTAEELILLETWVSNGSPESKDSCQVLASDECKERIPHLTKNTRRLTNFEFTQTIKDVFGNSAYQYAKAQFQRLPTDTNSRKFFDSEVSNYLSQSLLEAYQVIGETVGFYFIQGASQKAELDACLNNSQPDLGSCVTPWVVKLGAKAYRRPLASEELAILTKIYNDNLIYSVEDSIQMVVAGLIQSPYFVHLVENDLAGETPHADVYVLNQYEIASRLSYALWGSIPDDALMDAAKTGQLNSLDQLKTHAKRMSLDPRARVLASHFFKQYFGVNQVSSPAPSFDFLQGLSTAGLSQAAGAEMEAFSLELYDGNKPYRDFFLSRNAYLDPALTGSETLKTIYGVSTTGAVVLPPERAGI